MRAFYYLLYFFNNLLSIHSHKCGGKLGGLAPPQAPDERRLWVPSGLITGCFCETSDY